jgi:PilZ domain
MKPLRVYNPGSERVLSPRLLVIDAAREPIKVLKILTEGLAAHTRYGIWLVNCQGVPVARSASEFDLLYLDEQQRVLHGIEVSRDGEFEPFRGQSASILVLQPKTIARSRTFTGDRITIDSTENWSIDAEPASSRSGVSGSPATAPRRRDESGLTAYLSSQIATESSAKSVNVPSRTRPDTRPTTAALSDRLVRSGSLARDRSTIVRPAAPLAAAQSTEISQNAPERKVVPIAVASAPLSSVERSETAKVPTPAPTPSASLAARTATAPSLGAPRTIAPIPYDHTPRTPEATPAAAELHVEPKRAIAPTPRELTPTVPAPVIAEVPAKLEQPLVTHSFPASKVTSLEQSPVTHQSKIPVETSTPGGARENEQRREVPSFGTDLEAGDELERLRKKILAWLYPDPKSRRRRRRAPRIDAPGLVAYYFGGGPSTPHEVRNISVRGFYMVTNQRFMPGTILRVTLQTLESGGEDSLDSITMLSRVVRWGPDGGGFEFVFPGLKD